MSFQENQYDRNLKFYEKVLGDNFDENILEDSSSDKNSQKD